MEEKTRRSPKRLILNVPEELHQEIKSRASMRYQSITGYVLLAIIEKIIKEKQFE